jgi:hypothetical protein
MVLAAKGVARAKSSLFFLRAYVGMVRDSWRENMRSTRLKSLHSLEIPSVSSPRASLKSPVSMISSSSCHRCSRDLCKTSRKCLRGFGLFSPR